MIHMRRFYCTESAHVENVRSGPCYRSLHSETSYTCHTSDGVGIYTASTLHSIGVRTFCALFSCELWLCCEALACLTSSMRWWGQGEDNKNHSHVIHAVSAKAFLENFGNNICRCYEPTADRWQIRLHQVDNLLTRHHIPYAIACNYQKLILWSPGSRSDLRYTCYHLVNRTQIAICLESMISECPRDSQLAIHSVNAFVAGTMFCNKTSSFYDPRMLAWQIWLVIP